MIYVGMDISSKSFVIHAVNEKKKVVFKGEIEPSRKGLRALIKELGLQKRLFVFEAGNQMKWVALFFKKANELVHVVHPNEVKWIVASKGKTDKIDAKKLAELARGDMLPRAVHIVDGPVRDLRELVSARMTLQGKRVSLVNTILGYVKQEGVRVPKKFFSSGDWQEDLLAMKIGEINKTIIASIMNAIESLVKSEKELTAEIVAIEDKRIDLIETVPAIGKLSARVLLAAIDNAKRFDNSKCIANYGALTPTIYQSGNVTQLGRINRDGRQEVRKVLLQCAHTISRMKSPEAKPLKDFFEKIAKRRNKKIAVVALSRKLLTTVYGVMKSGQAYDPRKLVAA